MIVSRVGTVRGIRHRVSEIKIGIMDSLNIGIDDRTLYKQVCKMRRLICYVYVWCLYNNWFM